MMKWLPLIQDSKRKLDESKLLKYILKYKLVNNKSMTDTHWHYIYIYPIVPGSNLCLFKGQLGVSPTVYPWYLLCSLGILGDYNP